MTEAFKHVREVAAKELGISEDSIQSNTLLSSLFSDSLEYLSFVAALGLSDESVAHAETIGDLADACHLPN